jgi:hypothetical protein
MEAPKCRVCGSRHWGVEHVTSKATKPVASVTNAVTTPPSVTKGVTSRSVVTNAATEAAMIHAAMSPEHECPVCGRMHKAGPLTPAQKQAAYRQRHKA